MSTTNGVGNPGPGLREAEKCDRFKQSKGSSNGVDSCIERLVKHLTENQ
jgi:hypothetical protein